METAELLMYFQMTGIVCFVVWVGAYIGIHWFMSSAVNKKEKEILDAANKLTEDKKKYVEELLQKITTRTKELDKEKLSVITPAKSVPVVQKIYSMSKKTNSQLKTKEVKNETTKRTISHKS